MKVKEESEKADLKLKIQNTVEMLLRASSWYPGQFKDHLIPDQLLF